MRARWLMVLGLPAAFVVPAVGSAQATSCKAMEVGYAFASGTVIGLQPEHVDIANGGCVQFTNNIDISVTITVESGYSVTLGPKESTPPKDAYVGQVAGRHDVTAKGGPSSASGSITVAAAPSPTRSSSPAPTPRHSSSPTHSAAPKPSSSSTGPRVAPVPPTVGGQAPRSHVPSPPPHEPSVAPTAPGVTTTPVPSKSPTGTVVAFPVEPPSGRGAGLPGAVAALAVVGTGAGLVRVLLAEPVGPVDDTGRTVGRPT